jgi:hypothetical protein
MSELRATRQHPGRLSGAHGARVPAVDVQLRAARQAKGAEDAEMDFLAVCAIRSLGLGPARTAGLASWPGPGSVPAR